MEDLTLLNGLQTKAADMPLYSLKEVEEHRVRQDIWIVVGGLVFDVTRWSKKHPGGARIINHFAGQDATEAWVAMHPDKDKVLKYMHSLLVGRLNESDYKLNCDEKHLEITKDFRTLRNRVEKEKLFKPSQLFFTLQIAHIILLELFAYWLISLTLGADWLSYFVAAVMLTTAQAQSGWTQHDYGHLSVFPSSRVNHFMHYLVIGHLKGASSHWWNFRHFQHHTKPNIVGKDPDIALPYLFLLGEKIPVIWGKKRRGFAPYNWQQVYFWLVGPPTLLPLYFHYENLLFVFKRRDWLDLAWMVSFFVRFFYCYGPLLGGWGAFKFYMFIRFLESHWFTLVTQMNHITMDVDYDQMRSDWVSMQTAATCNVSGSWFNDWFTGHLNYQIEHHLFPTMPRHNYRQVAPMVRALCAKHNVPYVVKPLSTAIWDIYRSLKHSGSLWLHAYYHL